MSLVEVVIRQRQVRWVKILFLPPLVPFGVLWVFLLGAYFALGGVDMGIAILGMISPIFLLICLFLNVVDGLGDEMEFPWVWTLVVAVLMGFVCFFLGGFEREVIYVALFWAGIVAFMAFLRRYLRRGRGEVVTLVEGEEREFGDILTGGR